MKTRTGFVSNSSTTSFVIFGSEISEDDYSKARDIGLEVHHGDCSWGEGATYAGISWENIRDDETGLEFKTRVNQALLLLGVKDGGCTISEAYRDG